MQMSWSSSFEGDVVAVEQTEKKLGDNAVMHLQKTEIETRGEILTHDEVGMKTRKNTNCIQ